MTLADGRAKGMKIILEERGINTMGMNAAKMREALSQHEDFKNQSTLVEEKVCSRGHMCIFFPKFHCEMNPIERCWCHTKKYSRAYCNGTVTRLREIVPKALSTCTTEMILKIFMTCRDYEKAYREGCTCKNVDALVREYKSHRRIYHVNQ